MKKFTMFLVVFLATTNFTFSFSASQKSCNDMKLVCVENIFGGYTWKLEEGKICEGPKMDMVGKTCKEGDVYTVESKKTRTEKVEKNREVVFFKTKAKKGKGNGVDNRAGEKIEENGKSGLKKIRKRKRPVFYLPSIISFIDKTTIELQEVYAPPIITSSGYIGSTQAIPKKNVMNNTTQKENKRSNIESCKDGECDLQEGIDKVAKALSGIGSIIDNKDVTADKNTSKTTKKENNTTDSSYSLETTSKMRSIVSSNELFTRLFVKAKKTDKNYKNLYEKTHFPYISETYKNHIENFFKEVETGETKDEKLKLLYAEFERLITESEGLSNDRKKYLYYFKLEIAKKVQKLGGI